MNAARRRRSWLTATSARLALVLLVALTSWSMTGCATRPPPAGSALSGRLALLIAAQGSEPARQWSAGFELRGTASAGELDLTSPLGTVVAQARWRAGEVELIQGHERQRFDSLDALAQQVLGQRVPLEALFDWLRGRPWAGQPHEVTIEGFSQAGWVINVTALPEGMLSARRAQAPTLTLRARLDPAP